VQSVRLNNFGRETLKMLGMMLAGGLLTWILVLDGISDVTSRLSEELQPLYLAQVGGLKVVEIGILRSVFFLTMMVVTPPAGWLSDRIGEHHTIAVGFTVSGVGLFVFILASNIYGFGAAGILTGLGYGLIGPAYSSLTSKAVPEQNRGLAYGFFNTSIGILSLPAPWLGARLWESLGPQVPYLITAIAMLISAGFAYRKLKLPVTGGEPLTANEAGHDEMQGDQQPLS
jgi:MFS family permease